MSTSDLPELPRPALRGVLHAAALPLAVAGAALLWSAARPDMGSRATVAVFGLALVALYAVSSTYHLGHFSGRVRELLGRLDAAVIQVFIAATFTPIAFHALNGAWRTWSLIVAWIIALGGATIAVSPLRAPRWATTGGFLAVGWLTVVPLTRIVLALPWQGVGLIALGGLLYTVGAIVYGRQRPDPIPGLFGYHELFHLFVVAASTAHWVAIWRYVLPGA